MIMRAILTPTRRPAVRGLAAASALGLLLAACGSSGDDGSGEREDAADTATDAATDAIDGEDAGDRPDIVVTTTILGDIVENVVGDEAEVEVLLPLGADPHEASLSARQADAMLDADLVVVNGAGFEEGMASVIEAVDEAGTPMFVFTDHVELLEFGEDGHRHDDEEDEDAHDDEEENGEDAHDDEEDGDAHDDGEDDPHIWTDPQRLAGATAELGARIAGIDGIDSAAVERQTADYVAAMEDLDVELADLLAPIPEERRVLVTNHEVFGYFADRYEFEVVGTVIPSLTTDAEPSPAGLDDLAHTIEDEQVPAIFGETTQSAALAEALAASVGDVEVVTLFTESLGDGGSGAETYLDMMRTNAQLIAGALG